MLFQTGFYQPSFLQPSLGPSNWDPFNTPWTFNQEQFGVSSSNDPLRGLLSLPSSGAQTAQTSLSLTNSIGNSWSGLWQNPFSAPQSNPFSFGVNPTDLIGLPIEQTGPIFQGGLPPLLSGFGAQTTGFGLQNTGFGLQNAGPLQQLLETPVSQLTARGISVDQLLNAPLVDVLQQTQQPVAQPVGQPVAGQQQAGAEIIAFRGLFF